MEIFETILTFFIFGLIMFFEFFPFIFIIIIIYIISRSTTRSRTQNYFKNNVVRYQSYDSKYKNHYVDVSLEQLNKFNTNDINQLKNYFYDLFYDFEVACNNLDYKTLELLSTKQVYNNYSTGFKLNERSGRRKIIKNIIKNNVILYELESTLIKQVASLMIEISYINYTIDKNGNVISGNKNCPITEKFEVIFRKDFNRKKSTHCPNCGAHLDGLECDYCKSKVKEEDFKISSIKKIIEN